MLNPDDSNDELADSDVHYLVKENIKKTVVNWVLVEHSDDEWHPLAHSNSDIGGSAILLGYEKGNNITRAAPGWNRITFEQGNLQGEQPKILVNYLSTAYHSKISIKTYVSTLYGKDTDITDKFDRMVIDNNDEDYDIELAQRRRVVEVAPNVPKETPDFMPSEPHVADTIDKNLHGMEEEVTHMSISAITFGITSSDTPSYDRMSTPTDLNEDVIMKISLEKNNITYPVLSNDETLLLPVSDVLMDTKIFTTCVPTETQTSQADRALVDVAKTVS
ncbi:hypothetical protein BDR06DRAFT_971899 [Suillus hirtellus]|nr:hypothetical protein BDR06DRAFT_971899 [Suillus hirtellus]